jgi:Protein of unknown function (DUF1091)
MLKRSKYEIISVSAFLLIFLFQAFITFLSTSDVKNEKLYRCEKEVFKTSIDICKLGQIQGNFVAKIIMENFAPAANFELKCPFKIPKSNLTLTNITISDKFIPPFTDSLKYCVKFAVKICYKGERKFMSAFEGSAGIRFRKDLM